MIIGLSSADSSSCEERCSRLDPQFQGPDCVAACDAEIGGGDQPASFHSAMSMMKYAAIGGGLLVILSVVLGSRSREV